MIFKTFNSGSNKINSKIGIFTKSLEQIGKSIRQRQLEIHYLLGSMSKADAISRVGGFWSYVFGSNPVELKPYNLNLFKNIDQTQANRILSILQSQQLKVSANRDSWQSYFSALDEGQQWQIKFVQNNDLQKASLDDVILANNAACESARAHNNRLNQMTLGAKAATVATKALSMAGNMLTMWAVIKGIEITSKFINDLLHQQEKLSQVTINSIEKYKELNAEIETINSSLENTSKKIDELNTKENLTLAESEELEKLYETNKELERELSIKEKLAKINQGEAVGHAVKSITNRSEISNADQQFNQYSKQITTPASVSSMARSKYISNKIFNNGYMDTDLNRMDAVREKMADITELERQQAELKSQLEKADNKTYKQLEQQIAQNQTLIESYEKYISQKVAALQTEDDGIVKGVSEEGDILLEELKHFYDEVDAFLGGESYKAQKTLDGLFQKNIFKDVKDTLITLGKSGALSVETISNSLSADLLSYLDEANISAEQLLQYIMAIANPDALNYDNIRQQVKASFNVVDTDGKEITDNWAQEGLAVAESFTEEELKAYISVKASYGDEGTQFWTVQDWVSNIHASLQKAFHENESLTLPTAITENKEAIDTYQSKLNTIKESLSNLSSVAADSSAQLDLLQTLLELEPAFDLQMYKNADGTIRFEEALKALLIQLKNDALKAMPEQLEGYITDMADRVLYASSSFPSLSDAMSSMASGFALLSDVNAELEKTGALSGETLQKIIGKYGDLEPVVLAYLDEMASGQDILNALTNAYDNDLSNYKQYYAAKHIQDTNFYKKVVSNMGEDVKEKAKAYGVDLKNYASILALKQNLEQDFLNKSTADHEGLPEQRRGKDMLQALLAKRDAKKVLEGLDEAINASVSDYTPSYTTSSISPSSSSATQFSEEIDFTKYKLEELEQEIDRLRKKADNAAEAGRKSHTIDQILSVTQEKKEALLGILKLYQKEVDTLLASIPANYQDIAKNGAIAIESFVGASNEKVVSAIKEYRAMAGSVSDVNSQLLELNTTVQSLKLEKFNHLKAEYENQFGILSSFISQFKAQIDLFGSQGYPVSEKLYSQMMEKTSWQIEMLKKEREALVKQMSEIIKSTPDLSKDSFYEMANAITGIDSQITDCIASLEEFNNQIRDIPWNQFNRVIDGLESLGGELSGLENLLGSYDLTIDGEFSDYGLAQLGILAQQYELANYQTQQYAEAIEELDREYQSGKWSALEYSEKLQELVSAQWNSVSSATSAQKAILDLAKSRVDSEISSIDKAVDAYEELIQAQIKELKAEKELHDFRKSIEDQQSTITSLEKQLAAIQNDTSNAAQAKRAQLEEQLKNARDELDEMYYEQSIRDKEDALNEELERYKQLQEEKKKELEASLEDEDKLIGDYLGLANANASAIADILEELAREHGIKISDSIIDPWKSGEDAVTDYKGALKHASGSFKDSLDGIRESILSMTASADTLAQSFLEMFHVNTSAFLKDLTDIANLLNLISGEADKTTQHAGEWRYDKDKINSQNGNGSWWYEHTDGSYTKGGWEKIDGKWYYFDPEGWMKTSWHQDKDGSWYYLSDGSIGKEGEMLTDAATPDGYYVDSSGKWSQSAGAARKASLPAAFSQEDGIATVQPGEAVLYGNYSQLLKAAPASFISLALPRQNSCLPGQIQSISGDSYTIDNKVIVQGSVSTENMDRIISVMDKRVDLGFKKAYDKKCLKGRAFR